MGLISNVWELVFSSVGFTHSPLAGASVSWSHLSHASRARWATLLHSFSILSAFNKKIPPKLRVSSRVTEDQAIKGVLGCAVVAVGRQLTLTELWLHLPP